MPDATRLLNHLSPTVALSPSASRRDTVLSVNTSRSHSRPLYSSPAFLSVIAVPTIDLCERKTERERERERE